MPVPFAIWRAPKAPDDVEALAAVLGRGEERGHRAVTTLEDLLASEADVLVIRGGCIGGRRFDAPPSDRALDVLRRRRVFGIGKEARTLFGALGLPLSCMSFPWDMRLARVCDSPLAPPASVGRTLETHDPPSPPPSAGDDRGRWDALNDAVFLPSSSFEARVVEPLLRWEGAPLYAPVVRRHHHLWTGIGNPVASWSAAYADLLRTAVSAMARLSLRPLALPRPDVTAPGTHVFDLDAHGSLERPFRRSFFLAPEGPVRVRATLRGPGSGGLMLLLTAGVRGLEGARVDRRGDEPLVFEQLLLARSLAANPARCWEVDVTNFGGVPLRGVELAIELDPAPTLRLPGGETISVCAPVTDEPQIARLVDAYVASTGDLRSEVVSVLAEAPEVAVAYLEKVLRETPDPHRRRLLHELELREHRPRPPWPREPADPR